MVEDYVPDLVNVVGWKDLGASDAIGVTYMWYNVYTKELVDVDTALNSNPSYAWWQNSVTDDPDEAIWSEEQSSAYDVDVQNIMTHEAGHWLVLDDMYKKQLREGILSPKGGAGLGFIDIRRKTGNHLDYSFVKIDKETSFFIFTSTITR